ncbi:restriction endonuclease subunit S [Empedobacter falsenii]
MENLQPKLRFPEFRDNWKLKSLKEIGEIIGGGTPSTAIEEYWNGEINWFTPSEITSKYISSSKRKISELGVNKSSAKLLPVGSILLTTRATIGEVSICLEESTTNQGFQSIVVNNFNNNEFVYYLVNTLKNEFIKNSSGSTFLEISKKKIEVINNYFPTLQEQTKIADFLGAVDKQLDILNQKKEKLNLYKKGVMQQLFSQQIRFKDDNGNDFPDWEEKTLGEVGVFYSGTGFNEKEQGGKVGIPFIKVSDMNLVGNEILIKSANNYVTNNQIDRNNYKIIKVPTILFAKVGAAIYLERKRIGENLIIDNNMMGFSPNGNIMYYYYMFQNIRLSKYAQNGALPSYNSKDIGKIQVNIPSIEEQTKIANFLSAIDNQIQAVENQITKTETYKKGLLQQMFV